MASLVSRIVAVLAVVAASSSDVSGCVECSIDREAKQDNTCVIRCVSPGKDGPSVMINGEALRTVLDCDRHSLETNPYCLLRDNGISVGAKIKSSPGRTLFEYNPNTELCRDKCEFSVEFNGPTCSVVSEDLGKPCIMKPPTNTTEPTTTDTPSGPTTLPGDLPVVAGIIVTVISGVMVTIIIIVVILIGIICWKSKQGKGEGYTIATEGQLKATEPGAGTEKAPLIKKIQ